MNKVLFEKIVGPGFLPTSYKVESIEDLKAVMEKQEIDLNLRIYNENGEYYEIQPPENTPNNLGILQLIVSMAAGEFYYLIPIKIELYKKYIQDKLAFKINEKDKAKFFKDEFLRMEKKFLSNPYSDLLSPENYFNEVNSYEFITRLWIFLKNNNFEAVWAWDCNSGDIDSIHTSDDENDEGINSLFISLGEYITLKLMYKSYNENDVKTKSSVSQLFNPYPILFNSAGAFHLFKYIISQFPKKKYSRAFLSRHYYLFVENSLIERGATHTEYFTFLKDQEIDLTKIDDRTFPNKNDFNDFEKIRKNFELSQN